MYPDNWNPFDSELKDDINWAQQKARLNKQPRKPVRAPTGIESVDKVFGGGLPVGLTVLYGPSGAGKSKFAKAVATMMRSQNKKTLFFLGEDTFDGMTPEPPLVNTVDMISYRPGPERAAKVILKFIQQMKPDLVVVDSLTTIFGGTAAAVPEKDVREFTGALASRISGVVPMLAMSEVRGNDKYEAPAGGKGVAHAGLAVAYFGKKVLGSKWDAQDWSHPIGDIIWYFFVEKDRDGASEQGKLYQVMYIGDTPFFEPLGGAVR